LSITSYQKIKFNTMNLILNKQLTKKNFDKVFSYIFDKYNSAETIRILESLKLLGSIFSTKAGLSLSLNDLRIINKDKKIKSLLNIVENLKFDEIQNNVYNEQKINDVWNNTNDLLKTYILSYLKTNDPNNQLLIVLESGARGSREQIHQLIGLRSLMVDQSGHVVPFPIKKSFIDGLSIFEYLLSSFGARKGIIDTALKTADSGYLTRRLIESSYEIKIVSTKCSIKAPLSSKKRLYLNSKKSIILKNSVLSCHFDNNLCQKCFGLNYATRHIVSLGENIGILSAHSISEPSTQLTMRTFHTGGILTQKQTKSIRFNFSGFLEVYQRERKVCIIDWENNKKIFSLKKLKNKNTFSSKEQKFVNTNQKEDPNNLPIYIVTLSKNLTKMNLLRYKNQIFNEILICSHILKDNVEWNGVKFFDYTYTNANILDKFRYFIYYIFCCLLIG